MGPRRIGMAAASALGALALLGGAAGTASAAQCGYEVTDGNIFLTGGGPSIWAPEDDASIDEGGLFTGNSGRFDAFDGVGLPNAFGTDYNNLDADGCTFESGRRELAYPADTTTLTDLTLRPKIYISPRKPFARVLLTVRNTGNTETAVIYGFTGDMGSDTDTTISRTSSGDRTATQNDRWLVSCEDLDSDGCGDTAGEQVRDPEVVQVFQGRNNGQLDAITFADGDEDWTADYAGILVGPGEAKSVMYVVGMAATPGKAVRIAKAIDRDPAGYGIFKGMSKNERKFTRNF